MFRENRDTSLLSILGKNMCQFNIYNCEKSKGRLIHLIFMPGSQWGFLQIAKILRKLTNLMLELEKDRHIFVSFPLSQTNCALTFKGFSSIGFASGKNSLRIDQFFQLHLFINNFLIQMNN